MNLLSDNASVSFPEHLHWSAQDLADAVPLRLFELDLFDARDAMPSANREAPRASRATYLPAAPGLFRVR